MSNMTYMTDACLITAVLSGGSASKAEDVALAALEAGATGAFGFHARGYGQRERFGALGIAVEAERDVRSVLVSTDLLEVVFEAMHRAGDLERPGAGFLYVTPLDRVATYIPDAVVERLKEGGRWNPES